ncbi:hypothetical protein [Herbiconiux sp.]|uniref:hypothetical protein n=1 Tax=Herbiconiux sp. TaxID=1871186 RepID=UPI0025C19DDF|nr:hypothetical protein [Herbiconiux sp.]
MSAVGEAAAPDLGNLPRFLDHLAERDDDAARLARQLLADGGEVLVFWGPQQMDVWHLEVRRGRWIVLFRIERGMAEWPRMGLVADPPVSWDDYRPVGLAVLAWARANDVPFDLDGPDDLHHDLASHGPAALDWLGDGRVQVFDRLCAAWMDYRHARVARAGEGARESVRAEGLAALERAAAG